MSDAPTDTPPRVRLVQGQEVSLGCGTLILIALIVLIFGNVNRSRDRTDLSPVMKKLESLEEKIDRLEKKLEETKKK